MNGIVEVDVGIGHNHVVLDGLCTVGYRNCICTSSLSLDEESCSCGNFLNRSKDESLQFAVAVGAFLANIGLDTLNIGEVERIRTAIGHVIDCSVVDLVGDVDVNACWRRSHHGNEFERVLSNVSREGEVVQAMRIIGIVEFPILVGTVTWQLVATPCVVGAELVLVEILVDVEVLDGECVDVRIVFALNHVDVVLPTAGEVTHDRVDGERFGVDSIDVDTAAVASENNRGSLAGVVVRHLLTGSAQSRHCADGVVLVVGILTDVQRAVVAA